MRAQSLVRHYPAFILAATCALCVANLWLGPGLLNTRARGDSPFLIQRTAELVAALTAGDFPARWMPDAAFGLGFPFFNFYAALPYYAAAVLNLAGFEILGAIKATQTLGLAAAAAAMWFFASPRLGRLGATVAAVAYTTAPFHLVNVYVRGDSLSEFFAFVWYPLILWAIDRAAVAPRTSSWMALGASGAGLIVTHNVSALLFAPFAAAYAGARLIVMARERRGQLLKAFAFAVALALGLSAWFWAPALIEASGVQLDEQTTGYFNYANHFRTDNLVQWNVLFDYSADAPHAPMQMGALHAAGALLGLAGAILARRSIGRRGLLAHTGLFAASTFMMLPVSAAVWEYLPLLKLAQFPWRMLSVQAVFASALAGYIAPAIVGDGRVQTAARACACGLIMAAVIASGAARLPAERLDIRAVDVTPQTLGFYEWFTGNVGTTIRAEYLPRTAQPRPWTAPSILGRSPAGRVIEGDATITFVGQVGAAQRWVADVRSESAALILPRLFAPGLELRASASGSRPERALVPHPGTGWAEVRLPRGEHAFELVLGRTSVQTAAEAASLVAVVVVVLLCIRLAARSPRADVRRGGLTVLAGLLAFFATAGAARLVGSADAAPAPLQTVDFERRPFPHRSPISFQAASGRPYVLTSARMTPAVLRAGDAFELSLAWLDGRAPPAAELILESPSGLEGPRGDAVFVRVRDVSPADGAVTLHIVPVAALPGPLLPKLIARGADGAILPASAAGQRLSEVTLYGLTVRDTAGAPLVDVLRRFSNGIILHELDWFAQNTLTLCIRPTWSIDSAPADAWKVSFRLRGSDGRDVAVGDSEPLAGAAPTWSWSPGRPVGDSLCMVPIRSPLRDGEAYALDVIWYRAAGGVELSRAELAGTFDGRPMALNTPR